MKKSQIFIIILVVLLAHLSVSAKAVTFTCTGPTESMAYMYFQYMPPSFPCAQPHCRSCSLYFDRDYTVMDLSDNLKNMAVVPTLASEKLTATSMIWMNFTLSEPCDVYLIIDKKMVDINGLESKWLSTWTKSDGFVTDTGTHGAAQRMEKYDGVYMKNGADFSLYGQGNAFDPATGGGGQPTYHILVNADLNGNGCGVKIIPYNNFVSQNGSFLVFPNPFNQKLNISINSFEKTANVKVMDMEGRILRNLLTNGKNIVWDGKDNNGVKATAGTYLIAIKDGEKIYTSKVIMNQ